MLIFGILVNYINDNPLKKTIYYIFISVTICLLVGFLSSFATQSSVNDWYVGLEKPFFNPPNWVFAPVWSLLYIMMGVAAGLFGQKDTIMYGLKLPSTTFYSNSYSTHFGPLHFLA